MDKYEDIHHSGNWVSTPFGKFLNEAKRQSESPPQNDKYIAAFGEAINDLYYSAEYPLLFNLIEECLEMRKMMGRSTEPSYMFNHVLRDCQYDFLEIPGYPFEEKESWKESIKHYINPDLFRFNLSTREVSSNVAQRYKTIKLLLQLYPERFKNKPSIIDIGCSQNHGNILLNSNKARFDNLTVYDGISSDSVVDEHASQTANTLLNSRIKLGPCVGLDMTSYIHDSGLKRWARVCSFYPGEIKDPKKTREYDLLEKEVPSNVSFIEDDITELDYEKFVRSTGLEQADIVFMSTMLYQMTEVNRRKAIKNAIKMTKPDGFVIAQDFAHLDPEDHTVLRFESNWFAKPYQYRTLVLDMKDPTELKEVFAYINGRCEKVVILDEEIKKRFKDRESKIKRVGSKISGLLLGDDDNPDVAA